MSEQAQNNINDILDNIKEVITTGKAPSADNDLLVLTERVDLTSSEPVASSAPANDAAKQENADDDMAALMAQMSNQVAPQQQPQVSSPEPAAATANVAQNAQSNGDDMKALMEQMSRQPEPQPAPAAVASAPEVSAKAPSEEKDILEKIDEDADWGAALNEQKSLTSQDFSAPAFNQLKDNEKTDSLLSEQVAVKSMEKLKSLVEQLEPKQNRADSPSFRAGVTLEDLVMEAMKPEISKWLNDNLPQLVTSIVEKEIKKIIPR